jgi:hypothetical protein
MAAAAASGIDIDIDIHIESKVQIPMNSIHSLGGANL